MIIGITGKKQSGKDEVAKIIGAYLDVSTSSVWYDEIRFSQPLKDMVEVMLQLDDGETECAEWKDSVQMWHMTGREILQVIGTDVFRNSFRTDVWTSLWEESVKSLKHVSSPDPYVVVTPDVRFDNEAQLVHDWGGIILHVDRGGSGADPHPSEGGINQGFIDWYVDNNGTLKDLELQVLPIIKRFILRSKKYINLLTDAGVPLGEKL